MRLTVLGRRHFLKTEFGLEGAHPEQAGILWQLRAIAQPKQVQAIIKLTHGDPVWEEARGGILQEDLSPDRDGCDDLTLFGEEHCRLAYGVGVFRQREHD
ncbi:hypothetical protein KSX_53760 [Ktedonospora formicarum]|uniref:Uncharacterized protein n=1 Tax=Ktedonospora formicarum TaxID=2778364 RepID=A0A8J3I522_9CHLR|nr:hypothetical protein KSX_53760 [Ktedonospora formicarum]